MERRTALALAVAAAGTVMASTAAFAINIGLLRHEADKPVGILSSEVIDASFGADPTQVTVAVQDPGARSTDARRDVDDPTRSSSTISPSDDDRVDSDAHDRDGHSESTMPGHDDDD